MSKKQLRPSAKYGHYGWSLGHALGALYTGLFNDKALRKKINKYYRKEPSAFRVKEFERLLRDAIADLIAIAPLDERGPSFLDKFIEGAEAYGAQAQEMVDWLDLPYTEKGFDPGAVNLASFAELNERFVTYYYESLLSLLRIHREQRRHEDMVRDLGHLAVPFQGVEFYRDYGRLIETIHKEYAEFDLPTLRYIWARVLAEFDEAFILSAPGFPYELIGFYQELFRQIRESHMLDNYKRR